MPIKNRISDFQDDMIKWRHYFHQNPEMTNCQDLKIFVFP